MKVKRKILITAALPYANGPLHFGHIAGVYLPADCYARFERLRGQDLLFISGSDEYGVAITLAAELAGRTPQAHVDQFHAINKEFFDKLHISFDHYSRTTCKYHAPLVQQFFLDLLKNGHVHSQETEQLFSEKDGRFLADRYVVGQCPRCQFEEARGDECQKCGASYEATDLKNPRSKLTGASLVRKPTRHWFLLFDHFREALEKLLTTHPWRPNVTHFARSYLEQIRPRAITRDLNWGVALPDRKEGEQEEGSEETKQKVFYVWFDAPIGYISATQEWADKVGRKEAWRSYWCDQETKYVQFIGKDNIPFHALFFPAMILGQNEPYKVVDDLVASEFYNLEGKQFSKSEGWTIDLESFFKRFHADQIRYVIAANAPETGDSEFSWKDFQVRVNAELVGKFGNLVNRVLVFLHNHCGGAIPEKGALEEVDSRFVNEMARLTREVEEAYASYRLRRASQLVMELAQAGNVYFDVKRPWKAVKETHLQGELKTTMVLCLECLKALACLVFPLMPTTAEKLWQMLGFQQPLEKQLWNSLLETPLQGGIPLPQPSILFTKIEDELIEQELTWLKQRHEAALTTQTAVFEPLKTAISIEEFSKLDLRVGQILQAEKLPKSKKLLKLLVDIGLEKRTLVSGISHHYSPAELVGKKVIVVANLQPATLMGVESHGMVLAASLDSAVELLTLSQLPAGASIS